MAQSDNAPTADRDEVLELLRQGPQATLEGAVVTAAILHHTSFRETRLRGVDLRGCVLSTLDLRHTSLDGAMTDPDATGPADGLKHPPYLVVMGKHGPR